MQKQLEVEIGTKLAKLQVGKIPSPLVIFIDSWTVWKTSIILGSTGSKDERGGGRGGGGGGGWGGG